MVPLSECTWIVYFDSAKNRMTLKKTLNLAVQEFDNPFHGNYLGFRRNREKRGKCAKNRQKEIRSDKNAENLKKLHRHLPMRKTNAKSLAALIILPGASWITALISEGA